MKDGGLVFSSVAVAICEMSKTSWQRENSVWKAIWRTIQRTCSSFWSNSWSSSDFNARFIKTLTIWQESSTRYLSWLWADPGESLEMRYYDTRCGRSGKVGRIRNLSYRRINAKEVLITQKEDEFIIPVADGTRTHTKARTTRKERRFQWRSSKWTGKEPQPTELTDDVEARADLWSIQGDFIYRHHNEPRVQFYVPKEETFPIQPKYFDVTRSTQTDLDVLQEKGVDDNLEFRFKQKLLRFVERFHKVFSVDRITSHRIHVVRGKMDKHSNDYQNQTMYDQKYEPELIKPLRIERNKHNSTMLEDWQENALLIWMTKITKQTFKDLRRKLERPIFPNGSYWLHEGGCEAGNCIPKDSQNDLWLKSGISWIHKATSGMFSTNNTWRSHCRQRFHLDDLLQCGSQIYSFASSDENSGCKSCSGQGMEKARDNSSMAFGKSQE